MNHVSVAGIRRHTPDLQPARSLRNLLLSICVAMLSDPGLTVVCGCSFFLKTMGFTVPFAYGRGLFLGKGLLPLQTPINVVVGAPIPCSPFAGDTHSPKGAHLQTQHDSGLGLAIECSAQSKVLRDRPTLYCLTFMYKLLKLVIDIETREQSQCVLEEAGPIAGCTAAALTIGLYTRSLPAISAMYQPCELALHSPDIRIQGFQLKPAP